jgi:hypothetical protein
MRDCVSIHRSSAALRRQDPETGLVRRLDSYARQPRVRLIAHLLLCAAIATLSGCAGLGGREAGPVSRTARVSEALDHPSASRRASLRLVLDGLESDAAGQTRRARGSYERALQVDPANPYAYLALARLEATGPTPERARMFLDQAAAHFEAEGTLEPEVEVHLIGLRGEVLRETGYPGRAFPLLEDARDRAPVVWEDGHLAADELW